MALGQRIRQARQEAGLSQRQLCGGEITRNMLSLIENGTARPSMDTLCYLAQQLGKPVGWFLEESATPNEACMAEARRYYAEKEYTRALEILDSFRMPDALLEQEYRLLFVLAAMGAAEKAIAENKKVYGAQLLQKAWEIGQETVYFGESLRRQWLLSMYKTDQAAEKTLVCQLPDLTGELMLRAAVAETPAQSACLLDAVPAETPRWHLLRGQVALQLKDYEMAARCLRVAEAAFPREAITALEQCYREQENYKEAYLYACKLRQL